MTIPRAKFTNFFLIGHFHPHEKGAHVLFASGSATNSDTRLFLDQPHLDVQYQTKNLRDKDFCN